MNWFLDWDIGAVTLAVCILGHAFGLVFLASFFAIPRIKELRKGHIFFSAFTFAMAAIMAAILHIAEAAVWAAVYLKLDAAPNYSFAFLHSMGAFTTYRNAAFDIDEQWTLIDHLEAMNGVIAIGITVAFLYAIAGRLQNND